MPKYWMLHESARRQELMREAMINASGMPLELLEGAQRVLRAQHADREPTMQNGMDSPALVRGEEYKLVESHVNAHGETVLSAYRQNGPHLEQVRITQAQADRHTRVVSDVRGLHRGGR